MNHALWVFVGGGIGAVLRWSVGLVMPSPWGTLGVNVLGSALFAFLAHEAVGLSGPWRLLILAGLLGGFTTYSTFNFEVFAALERGEPGRAALVAGATFGLCLAGAWGGWLLAPRLVG